MKNLRPLAFAAALACAALPALAQNPYGAVVLGRAFGGDASGSLGWSDRGYDEAGERARGACHERGAAACLIVGYARASCGALAIDDKNGPGVAWGDSTDSAGKAALSACRGAGRSCRLLVSGCAK